MRRLAFVLTLAVSSSALAAAKNDAIAVLDLQGTGVAPELLPTLTEILTVEIAELGLYRVIAGRDIQSMLGFERQKDVLGCSDAACLAEIGGALGVERIVAGHIGMVGSTYVVNIKLINIRMADTEGRVYETVRGQVDDLIDTVKKSVQKLLGPGSKAAARTAEANGSTATASLAPAPSRATPTPAPATPPPAATAPTPRADVADLQAPPTVSVKAGRHLAVGVMPIVFWSAGVLALGGGVATGIGAKDAEKKANDPSSPGSQKAAQQAPELATISNVLAGAGLVAIVGGFAWSYFVTGAPATTALAPVVGRDTVGLAAVGSF